ncbi:hypothetical protein LCGC14_2787450, partial [marine sediment metagenome]
TQENAPEHQSHQMNVLLVGSGAREHALAWKLRQSPKLTDLFVAPGNAGTAALGANLPLNASDVEGLTRAAKENRCELVVVGPEDPLARGLVDRLAVEGIAAFGPSRSAARIESSKAFAKALMERHGIPTARTAVFTNRTDARNHIEGLEEAPVVKADGLAAGKGVIIADNLPAAKQALETYFVEQRFGEAGSRVILEEHLEGEELSLLALCDGENVIAMAPAQDYKRIYDGDEGPNTGGMGSYSPVPGIDPARTLEIVANVHQPVVDLLRSRGTPYRGVLYAGLMLTTDGPKVLEFNCRFGDPETQAVLPRLQSDLLAALEGCLETGGLAGSELRWSDDWAVTVVLASAGYPASSSKGDVIAGLEGIPGEIEVTHAGTARRNGEIVTAGGRVLNVTGLGPSPEEARSQAYSAV